VNGPGEQDLIKRQARYLIWPHPKFLAEEVEDDFWRWREGLSYRKPPGGEPYLGFG